MLKYAIIVVIFCLLFIVFFFGLDKPQTKNNIKKQPYIIWVSHSGNGFTRKFEICCDSFVMHSPNHIDFYSNGVKNTIKYKNTIYVESVND
jgi:hypothetical protein